MEPLLLLAVLAAVYLLGCVIWPYRPCPRCRGGKSRSPSGRAWRDCGRCGGTGRRIRVGARLFRG